MGPSALLPLRRNACWGFFRPKNPTASSGFEPANLGTKGRHAKMKKKVVWYRRGYEWGGGSRVGPPGVADGIDDKQPSTVMFVKVEASLAPYPGEPKSRHCIRWGSVLERSGVGYVWYRCGSVEPFVRGGLFQSYRVLF